MLDIETLGRTPAGMIITIGAVEFNKDGVCSNQFYEKIDWQDAAKFGDIDVNSVKWWMQQSDEARAEAISGIKGLKRVLSDFKKWFPNNAYVWAKGPTFDITIMEHAFKQCNVSIPWHFRSVQCVRTIEALTAGYIHIGDYSTEDDVAHDALSDAIFQAKYVSAMLKHLSSSQMWYFSSYPKEGILRDDGIGPDK